MSRPASVLVLANQKGGVAKTTTTLNLGAALKERGCRVLAIDLDPQSNLSMSQGIDIESLSTTMYDVLVRRRAALRGHPRTGDRHRRRGHRARRRRARAVRDDRTGTRARSRDQAVPRSVRLHPDRHAAVARPADDQRDGRRRRGHRPRAVRVPVAPRPRAAAHRRSRRSASTSTRGSTSSGSSRRCTTAARSTAGRRSRCSRRASATSCSQHEDRQDHQVRRGPGQGP